MSLSLPDHGNFHELMHSGTVFGRHVGMALPIRGETQIGLPSCVSEEKIKTGLTAFRLPVLSTLLLSLPFKWSI